MESGGATARRVVFNEKTGRDVLLLTLAQGTHAMGRES